MGILTNTSMLEGFTLRLAGFLHAVPKRSDCCVSIRCCRNMFYQATLWHGHPYSIYWIPIFQLLGIMSQYNNSVPCWYKPLPIVVFSSKQVYELSHVHHVRCLVLLIHAYSICTCLTCLSKSLLPNYLSLYNVCHSSRNSCDTPLWFCLTVDNSFVQIVKYPG
jgi:hypothetical protein